MRHGDRLDCEDPLWKSTAERPWDPPLSDTGKARAFAIGKQLKDNLSAPIHRVIVSPFLRCVQTASQIVSALCTVDKNANYMDVDNEVKVTIEWDSGNNGTYMLQLPDWHERPESAMPSINDVQLSSQNSKHDEIDFEFLGNRTGQPYILQTNVFTGEKGDSGCSLLKKGFTQNDCTEFRFRRLIEANRRLRVRRYRSRVPYGVESDSSAAFSSAAAAVQAVRSGGGTIVSEGLNEMDGVSPKDSAEGVVVEDLRQDGKEQGNGMANFDCNVCLDVAKEPVVTSCGHLFCWPCLYQWLHIHCDHRECPVCKGEVTEADITPIYGRGNSEKESGREGKEVDSSLKIPPRPRGRRSEGLRQRISRPLLRRPRLVYPQY
ncbi:hypothetical protein IFM89_038604 [Coptis chinensis]|uniref:E3 ubiquitin-protein ligase RMA n=1 Tax=Coptis chinensis TaxID=261450 RepID=A0A835LU67_9MAGN|nr:hypothetical protein IFM89_038604 [Coptis chinensis]